MPWVIEPKEGSTHICQRPTLPSSHLKFSRWYGCLWQCGDCGQCWIVRSDDSWGEHLYWKAISFRRAQRRLKKLKVRTEKIKEIPRLVLQELPDA